MQKAYRLLIADDNDEDISLLLSCIGETGHPVECTYARDGEALFEALTAQGAGLDLAMIDFYLPRRTAAEVVTLLQQSQQWPAFPIVVLSSFLSAAQQDALIAGGVRTILTKPNDLSGYTDLVAALLAILQEKERSEGSIPADT